MKYKENIFDDYISTVSIHPNKTVEYLQKNMNQNLIVYGPPGIGKYTLVINALSKISDSKLKYSKKIYVNTDKIQIVLNLSDVHYELDMSTLIYNSKILWHEIYQQIIDSICSNTNTHKIILCKYFHEINNELLDNFYNYMQDKNISFILLTEELSFIPDNICNVCKIINVKTPTNKAYNSILQIKRNIPYSPIINIKNPNLQPEHVKVCNEIIQYMLDIPHFNYLIFRTKIYELLVYNLNIPNSLWYILKYLITYNHISPNDISHILKNTIECLHKYNNNYHNIFHLEYYLCFLITQIQIH
jgi:hypothetical protein